MQFSKLLNIYSKYNIISFKLLLKSIFSKKTSNSYKDRALRHNLQTIKNIDVYTKYALKEYNNGNISKISTANKNITNLYKFLLLKIKYQSNNSLDDISQQFLKCSNNLKIFSMSNENDKIVPYFIISNEESIRNIENNLINFKILPEKEKDILINQMLDFVENLTKVKVN